MRNQQNTRFEGGITIPQKTTLRDWTGKPEKTASDIFRAVKEQVTARQAAEFYGLKVSHNGMACCPFHDDHHPSLKLDERYYCFGCHATGDVIDFVSAYLKLTPFQAAKRLAQDFQISYDEHWHRADNTKTGLAERIKALKVQQEKRAFLEWKRQTLSDLAEWSRILEAQKEKLAPKKPDEPFPKPFLQCCRDQDCAEFYICILENGSDEERMSLYKDRAKTTDELSKRVLGFLRQTDLITRRAEQAAPVI